MNEMSQSVKPKVNPYEMFLPRQVDHITEVDDHVTDMDFFLLYKSSHRICKSAPGRWSVLVSFTDGPDQMAHLFSVHNVDDKLTVKRAEFFDPAGWKGFYLATVLASRKQLIEAAQRNELTNENYKTIKSKHGNAERAWCRQFCSAISPHLLDADSWDKQNFDNFQKEFLHKH